MREFEGNARANRERELAERILACSWHFPRRSKATKAKGESLGESGDDWGSWAAVGGTETHHMGWGDTGHTHTYAHKGAWPGPQGLLGCMRTAVLWDAPVLWCSGMHHDAPWPRVGWYILGQERCFTPRRAVVSIWRLSDLPKGDHVRAPLIDLKLK